MDNICQASIDSNQTELKDLYIPVTSKIASRAPRLYMGDTREAPTGQYCPEHISHNLGGFYSYFYSSDGSFIYNKKYRE